VRVLYSFPDRLGSAGVGTTALHQVRGLVEEGIEVVLYCTSCDVDVPGVQSKRETLVVAGKRIPHSALGVERAYRFHDRRVANALKRLDGIDVVHSWPKATVETAKAAHLRGIPVVREVPNTHTAYAFESVARETAALGLPADGYSHAYDAKVLAREEEEYARADLLLVPSEFSRRTFTERGVPPEKLALHQYGYDPTRYFSDPAPRPDERPFTMLFAGRCEPRKGLHHAIRAWLDSGAAEHGRFLVCGRFVPGYREALAGLLDHPSIEVQGFVDLAPVMRESDVFVLPSIEEGSALVTYEAQASGCVLAVSDAAGARCEHGRQGLVHQAGDVATLTRHLRELATDRELLARLRAATLAGRATLTWEHAAREVVGIYADLVAAARQEA
jgi:glycosyltransferase involved in cell wall biosynthesis